METRGIPVMIEDVRTLFVSHRPALGYLDHGTDGKKVRSHIGSGEIRMMIEKQKPLLHLFGHVHSGFSCIDFRVNGAYPRSRSFFRIAIPSEGLDTIEAIKAAVPGA
jgi:Icc-related predicted phosphoesterase